MTTLVILILLGVVFWLGAAFVSKIKAYDYIGRPEAQRDTIAISGEGKVTAVPDIASIRLGLATEKEEVAAAQKENTEKMNDLIKELKGMGVDEEDIQTTTYNIYPRYDYKEESSELRGYEVSQQVTVKIRDLSEVGDILTAAGEIGANQVGGLQFTIDDKEDLREEARAKALENAQEKAETLADSLDVDLGRIVSFNETEGGSPTPYPYYREEAMGLGGSGTAPDIQAGSNEVIMYVTVIYEIK